MRQKDHALLPALATNQHSFALGVGDGQLVRLVYPQSRVQQQQD
jgi:hypothetical protein